MPLPSRPEIGAVFDSYADGSLPVAEFDDALWTFLCDRVNDREPTFGLLPITVQYYFASRYVEWEVGNGGFAQAAFNIPHLFELARLGYLALDLGAAASLIAEAQSLIAQGHAQFSDPEEAEIGELFEEFAESALSKLNDRTSEAGGPRTAGAPMLLHTATILRVWPNMSVNLTRSGKAPGPREAGSTCCHSRARCLASTVRLPLR